MYTYKGHKVSMYTQRVETDLLPGEGPKSIGTRLQKGYTKIQVYLHVSRGNLIQANFQK